MDSHVDAFVGEAASSEKRPLSRDSLELSREGLLAWMGCLGRRALLLGFGSGVFALVAFLFGGCAELIDNAHVG